MNNNNHNNKWIRIISNFAYKVSSVNTVTQRPQYKRNQKYRSGVFCDRAATVVVQSVIHATSNTEDDVSCGVRPESVCSYGNSNHENGHVRGTGQGEARHRKYKRLKLVGGQAYDSSND
jgi:hypothetical protein